MNWKIIVPRTLLGFIFFGAGLAGLLGKIPPEQLPPTAANFMAGLAGTGYFFPFLKATETILGLLLLTGFLVPFSLVILAPIVLNIFLYHAILAPSGITISVVIMALLLVSAWNYRQAFQPLLRLK